MSTLSFCVLQFWHSAVLCEQHVLTLNGEFAMIAHSDIGFVYIVHKVEILNNTAHQINLMPCFHIHPLQ